VVRVRAPATSGNLGPGFDCLGMALDLFNEASLEEGEDTSVLVEGYGGVPLNSENLVFRAAAAVFRKTGRRMPGLVIRCYNRIPISRGLGSSAAALAMGLVGANRLLGEPLGPEELLELGWRLEGHPDNIAPALFGGCRVAMERDGRIFHAPIPVPEGLRLALFIPDFPMPTMKSRSLLSPEVPRRDAIFNIARAALLVASLATSRLEWLRAATEDRLHQPARSALFPAMYDIFEAALNSGALGVCLSGGGSAVLAFAAGEAEGVRIAEAMAREALKRGVRGEYLLLRPSPVGAHVVE